MNRRSKGTLTLGLAVLLGVSYFIWPSETQKLVDLSQQLQEVNEHVDDDFWLNDDEGSPIEVLAPEPDYEPGYSKRKRLHKREHLRDLLETLKARER